MKFSVGYQLPDEHEEPLVDLVSDYREHVAEVYFAWAGMPSGRANLTERRGYVDWTGQRRLEADLAALRQMGVRLNLLLNANCYGGLAVSQYLKNQVASLLDHLGDLAGGVDAVTTASPAVAAMVKEHSPQVEVRASVNMRIGTVDGMAYVAHLFDGYCVQREHNRDLAHLARLRQWADREGKRLTLLANSGCLPHCSGQTFHDNLVAHEREVDETLNVPGWSPTVCRGFLRDRSHWPVLLRSTWIRPEDVARYEGRVDQMKLATRMHSRPRLVLDAYARGRHVGNLLDLLEPGFAGALAPMVIDNTRFTDDWFERTSTCGRRCETCDYCERVLEDVLVNVESPPARGAARR